MQRPLLLSHLTHHASDHMRYMTSRPATAPTVERVVTGTPDTPSPVSSPVRETGTLAFDRQTPCGQHLLEPGRLTRICDPQVISVTSEEMDRHIAATATTTHIASTHRSPHWLPNHSCQDVGARLSSLLTTYAKASPTQHILPARQMTRIRKPTQISFLEDVC